MEDRESDMKDGGKQTRQMTCAQSRRERQGERKTILQRNRYGRRNKERTHHVNTHTQSGPLKKERRTERERKRARERESEKESEREREREKDCFNATFVSSA